MVLNGYNKTIFKNLDQQFESYQVQTKITTYIELYKYFGWKDEEGDKMAASAEH